MFELQNCPNVGFGMRAINTNTNKCFIFIAKLNKIDKIIERSDNKLTQTKGIGCKNVCFANLTKITNRNTFVSEIFKR